MMNRVRPIAIAGASALTVALVVLGAQWQAIALGHVAIRSGGAVMVEVVPPAGQRIAQRAIEEIRIAPGIRAVAPVRMFDGRLGQLVEGHQVFGLGGSVFAVAPPPDLFTLPVGSVDGGVSGVILTPNGVRSLGLTTETAVGSTVFIDVRRGAYREQTLRITLRVAGVVGDGVVRGIAIVTPTIGDQAERWMTEDEGGRPAGAQRLWVYADDSGTAAAVAKRAGLSMLGPSLGTR